MGCKYSIKVLILIAFIVTSYCTLDAQEIDDQLQKSIRNQQYVFVALSFTSPSVNNPRMITDYDLRVTTDSIIANLPFFGQNYSPQIGRSDDDGIRFTSVNFEYSAVAKKKGKWVITIKPKDKKGVQIFLTVYNNREATMEVSSPNKETMIFKGYVR
jgi:Domain of unknown function (DUF4251)